MHAYVHTHAGTHTHTRISLLILVSLIAPEGGSAHTHTHTHTHTHLIDLQFTSLPLLFFYRSSHFDPPFSPTPLSVLERSMAKYSDLSIMYLSSTRCFSNTSMLSVWWRLSLTTSTVLSCCKVWLEECWGGGWPRRWRWRGRGRQLSEYKQVRRCVQVKGR